MKRKIGKHKILYSLLIAFAVIAAITTFVYAAFLRNSDTVTNTFAPAVSKLPEIQETFDDNVKKEVKIAVGETKYPVYVRAELVFNWQEKDKQDGVVYFNQPVEGKDYTLTINESKWELKEDGYYYYKDPVASKGVTESLITEFQLINPSLDENYALSVRILAQTVQAVGHTDDNGKSAAEDAWNIALEP